MQLLKFQFVIRKNRRWIPVKIAPVDVCNEVPPTEVTACGFA